MIPTSVSSRRPQLADAIGNLPIAGAFKRFIIPPNLDRIYDRNGADCSPREFTAELLRKLSVRYQVTEKDLARIPGIGPVIVVSNHPFGILEGIVLFDMISRVRPDVKILANSLLANFPEMGDRLILVDPFGASTSAIGNQRGVRETLSYLASGGLLIVFPAGEVSHIQIRQGKIADPGWNQNVARFIRRAKATVTPIFIKGANSLGFQLMGMIHSQLRTARLLHELMNKGEKTVELRIGNPIACEALAAFTSNQQMTRYLRYRTYLLENRGQRAIHGFPKLNLRSQLTIAAPAFQAEVEAEIARLPALAVNGDLEVYRAKADQIPQVLHEIGRLREITFRAAGEGTGKVLDLDRFDNYYHHLFLWDRSAKKVAGAYRLGVTAEILPRFGSNGLYTSTLFHFDKGFFARIGPAIEMGRSFVRPEYQKQYGTLLLLWKGIGAYIAQNPGYPVLFGPVSISNNYHPVSRRLIVQYLQAQKSVKELASLVKPRHKFRVRTRGADNAMIRLMLRDIEELSSITADIEADGKGIPILLKHYLKLGGKLLGFNVDPMFADALDGLILVDLTRTAPGVLQRYIGRDGMQRFLGYHRVAPSKSA